MVTLGLSQYEIADKLGVSQSTVRRRLAEYGLSTVKRVGPRPKSQRFTNCGTCDKPLENGIRQFCSLSCSSSRNTRGYIDRWLAGAESGANANGELKKIVRDWLLAEANYRCMCGWSEVNTFSGKVTLNIDHIDGDARNNARSNLRVLCCNCHTLTPTYNALNKGKGTRYQTPGLRERNRLRD